MDIVATSNIVLTALVIGWLFTFVGSTLQLIKDNMNFWKLFGLLTSCYKCITFWLALSMTGDIVIAGVTAFIAYIIDKYILSTF